MLRFMWSRSRSPWADLAKYDKGVARVQSWQHHLINRDLPMIEAEDDANSSEWGKPRDGWWSLCPYATKLVLSSTQTGELPYSRFRYPRLNCCWLGWIAESVSKRHYKRHLSSYLCCVGLKLIYWEGTAAHSRGKTLFRAGSRLGRW